MEAWKPGTFAGETVSHQIGGALLSEVRHTNAKCVAPHSHEAPYFSLLLDGGYSESAQDFSVCYEPYTLVFHSAYTPHEDAIGASGCRMFFVELLPEWRHFVEGQGPLSKHFFVLDGGAPLWLLVRLYREFLAGEAASPITVESLTLDLCSYILNSEPDQAKEPAWLSQLEARVKGGFRTRLDLEVLSAEIGVHPGHMCRVFRRFRNKSLGDYITGLRIQFVTRRLTQSSDTLGEIAQASGFSDQSHMTRVFHRFVGSSPGAYRTAASA
jgi:AraC family transcriptional regulator